MMLRQEQLYHIRRGLPPYVRVGASSSCTYICMYLVLEAVVVNVVDEVNFRVIVSPTAICSMATELPPDETVDVTAV